MEATFPAPSRSVTTASIFDDFASPPSAMSGMAEAGTTSTATPMASHRLRRMYLPFPPGFCFRTRSDLQREVDESGLPGNDDVRRASEPKEPGRVAPTQTLFAPKLGTRGLRHTCGEDAPTFRAEPHRWFRTDR